MLESVPLDFCQTKVHEGVKKVGTSAVAYCLKRKHVPKRAVRHVMMEHAAF